MTYKRLGPLQDQILKFVRKHPEGVIANKVEYAVSRMRHDILRSLYALCDKGLLRKAFNKKFERDVFYPVGDYETPTVKQMVEQHLRENGYDGLGGDDCGCEVDDLMPCCTDLLLNCQASWKTDCDPETCWVSGDCEWHMTTRKETP